ncbi:MAG: NDP-sugar synthase [Candidatus Diapherotrites archaeon]|nr:NDP-sugar synthase [Candidatus Diapherotrites archaeon]
MAKVSGRVTKAIILAGGTGGRLHALTGGSKNKVNLEIHGKPLIAYQLEALKKLGVKQAALVVRPDHESEFEQMIESGKYPKLDYKIVHTPFQKSGYRTRNMLAKVFREAGLETFAGKSPVIITFGDAYYFSRFLKRAIADFAMRKRTVFLAAPEYTTSAVENAFAERVVESRSLSARGYNPALNGFIATPRFLQFFSSRVAAERPLLHLLRQAHEAGVPSAIMHGQLINMNNPADYIAIREILAGRLRFPFPKNWIRHYIPELERITRQRERRIQYKNRLKDHSRRKRRNLH